MRRAQHADAHPAEICERRIHIVAPHDDLGPWRAGAGGHAVHVPQRLDRGQPRVSPSSRSSLWIGVPCCGVRNVSVNPSRPR
jgi:hypothetical protein